MAAHRGFGQSGFLLIEAMVSILIFSLGILGIVALQAVVIKETSDAQYRIEASMFTNQLIAEMWAEDKVNLATNFASPDGPRYQAWRTGVTTTSTGGLPGAALQPPTVVFGPNNQVTISVFWQLPGAAAGTPFHQHTTITQLQ